MIFTLLWTMFILSLSWSIFYVWQILLKGYNHKWYSHAHPFIVLIWLKYCWKRCYMVKWDIKSCSSYHCPENLYHIEALREGGEGGWGVGITCSLVPWKYFSIFSCSPKSKCSQFPKIIFVLLFLSFLDVFSWNKWHYSPVPHNPWECLHVHPSVVQVWLKYCWKAITINVALHN